MGINNQIIGLKKGTVNLLEHNEQWHIIAQYTIDELKCVLKDIVVDVEHIGSTSIHNIYAKPVIDIVIGLKNLSDIQDECNFILMEKHGFIHDKEHDNKSKIFFFKGEGDIITHHIHAVVYKEEAWNYYTKLRDYLNNTYDMALKYQSLKLQSMRDCDNDMSKYYEGKAEFFKEINMEIEALFDNEK